MHGVALARFAYAASASIWAWLATASPAWSAPVSVHGGKPVIAEPGLTPTSPVITDRPVHVTVEAPRTAKPTAEPRLGAVAANAGVAENRTANGMTASPAVSLRNFNPRAIWLLPVIG